MVDFKIPLIWLIGGFILALTAAINMYYQLQEVSKGVAALTITVNAGNNTNIALAGKQALLEFRLNTTEAEVERLKTSVIQFQAARNK
jgi:hypothetical protein